jgi:DNA-binding MarR family transcriptional regulator
VPTTTTKKQITHALPQDRGLCACTTLRGLARRATAIYDDLLEPVGLKQTQYTVLARLDRLVHCSLGELATACDLDVTSLSRGLRPLVTGGWVKSGPGKDDRTKRYELTTLGKQVLRKAFPLWKQAQSRVHDVIAPEHVRTLESLSGILKEAYLG